MNMSTPDDYFWIPSLNMRIGKRRDVCDLSKRVSLWVSLTEVRLLMSFRQARVPS